MASKTLRPVPAPQDAISELEREPVFALYAALHGIKSIVGEIDCLHEMKSTDKALSIARRLAADIADEAAKAFDHVGQLHGEVFEARKLAASTREASLPPTPSSSANG